MEDGQIVDLYWQRSDLAISETNRKYGRYCHSIAYHICGLDEDAEECVNDTWLRAWNAMPDQRPAQLKPFLGRLTRWVSLDRRRREGRERRGGGDFDLALEELDGCLAGPDTAETALETAELTAAINRFLASLRPDERTVFLARYYFGYPLQTVAERHGFGLSKVKTMLHRTRKKLRSQLRKEGYL